MAAPRPAMKGREPVRPAYTPDPDEVEALGVAAAELKMLCPAVSNAEAVASAVIAKWIMTRARLAAGARLTETVAFDLGDARMRGFIEAALPQIGAALSSLPADMPLFGLSKPQILDVLCAGVQAWCEAVTAVGENPSFPMEVAPFDVKRGDPIPFGGPLTLAEAPF